MKNDNHYIHHVSYSYRERIIGIFLFLGLILFLFFIVLSVKNEHLFEKQARYYINVDSSEGISRGDIVKALGIEIGRVSDLNLSKEGKIKVAIEVYEKRQSLVRVGARAKINRLTNIGNALIEITFDSVDAAILPANSTIPIDETASLNDLLLSMANLIQRADKENLLSRIDTMLPKLEYSLKNMHLIIEQVASGRGTLGAAIFDENVEDDLRIVVESGADILSESQSVINIVKQGLIQIEPVLKETRFMIKDVRKVSQSLPKLVKELREMVAQTNTALIMVNNELNQISGVSIDVKRTLSKTNRLLDSVQNTWPLSNNVQKTNQPLLIPVHSNHE